MYSIERSRGQEVITLSPSLEKLREGLQSLAAAPSARNIEVNILLDNSRSMRLWTELGEKVRNLRESFRETFPLGIFAEITEVDSGSLGTKADSSRATKSLTLIISDTLGDSWKSGERFQQLESLGKHASVVLIHIFDDKLAQRTALETVPSAGIVIKEPLPINSQLEMVRHVRGVARSNQLSPIQIFMIEENSGTLGEVLMGRRSVDIAEAIVAIPSQVSRDVGMEETTKLSADDRLREFYRCLESASPVVDIINCLAIAPITPEIVAHVKNTLISPTSTFSDLAEALLGPLIKLGEDSQKPWANLDFHEGVRAKLLSRMNLEQMLARFNSINDFVHRTTEVSFNPEQEQQAPPGYEALWATGRYLMRQPNVQFLQS